MSAQYLSEGWQQNTKGCDMRLPEHSAKLRLVAVAAVTSTQKLLVKPLAERQDAAASRHICLRTISLRDVWVHAVPLDTAAGHQCDRNMGMKPSACVHS